MPPRQSSAPASRSDSVAESVWTDLRGPLLGFISRRVPTPHDAEDVLQDVMVRIHRHADDLEHADRVASWVYRIATNSIADHYRRPMRREMPAGQATDVPGLPDLPASAAAEVHTELANCVGPLIAALPEIYRDALDMTEVRGVAQTQAAAQLGLSVSGMKARVQRGRAQLKDLLLDCCEVELDSRGTVADYRPRRATCATCIAR